MIKNIRYCFIPFLVFQSYFGQRDVFFTRSNFSKEYFTIFGGVLNSKTIDLLWNLPKYYTEQKKKNEQKKNNKSGENSVPVENNGLVRDNGLGVRGTTTKELNKFELSLLHFFWQLAKFSIQYKKIVNNRRSWFLSGRFFNFEYNLKYLFTYGDGKDYIKKGIPLFKLKEDPDHICIAARVSIFSIDLGYEFNYNKNNNRYKRHYFAHSIAVGLAFCLGIPDIIIRYCPFIYNNRKTGFYLRLELIQFSIMNVVSTIIWAKKGEEIDEKLYKKYFPKRKDYFINVSKSLLHNMKIEFGVNFDITDF